MIKRFFSEEFFHSDLVQWALIGALLLNLATWVALAFYIRPVDFLLVLHYNVYFGVDLIGDWWQAYFLALIGFMVIILNAVLGLFFYRLKERIISHVLLLGACMTQICVAIATAGIIVINY